MSLPVSPDLLCIIFHGPWGFLVDPNANTITALTPVIQGHTYYIGEALPSAPYSSNLDPCGRYTFDTPSPVSAWSASAGQARVLQTVYSGGSIQPLAKYCSFDLPLTDLRPGRQVQRYGPTPDGSGCWADNLLCRKTMADSRLNRSSTSQTTYLAVNQILTYNITERSRLNLAGWSPASKTGNIKLHVVAQEPPGKQPAAGAAHTHFGMMAGLFGLDLDLTDAAAALTTWTLDPQLPPTVVPADLLDLGEPAADQTAPRASGARALWGGKDSDPEKNGEPLFIYPNILICGSNLVVTI